VRDKKERALLRRREREREAREPSKRRLFVLQDFIYDESTGRCVCPAGHSMYHSGRDMLFNGYRVAHYKAPITACRHCPLRAKCLRNPETSQQRQLTILKHREGPSKSRSRSKGAAAERMRRKFDTPQGRAIYSRRMQTVEPVFANLQNKGMRRFTLRGRAKVNAQWQLFTMVHNIEKIAHLGVWN
jgi:hypothetical protein